MATKITIVAENDSNVTTYEFPDVADFEIVPEYDAGPYPKFLGINFHLKPNPYEVNIGSRQFGIVRRVSKDGNS